MHRIMVIQTPDKEERVLGIFTLKATTNTCKIVEARFPGKTDLEILHPSFDGNELVMTSSTSVGLVLHFFPAWSIMREGSRSEVTHGQDLLELIRQDLLRSGYTGYV